MTEQEPHLELTWKVHPAARRHAAAVVALLVILSFAVVAGVLMRSPWWAAGVVGFFAITLNRFFFPSRFSIDGEGLTASYPLQQRRIRWVDLRRFAHDDRGGYLSRRAKASWLDTFRGVHVLFDDEREAIVARIRSHLLEGGVEAGAAGDASWAR